MEDSENFGPLSQVIPLAPLAAAGGWQISTAGGPNALLQLTRNQPNNRTEQRRVSMLYLS